MGFQQLPSPDQSLYNQVVNANSNGTISSLMRVVIATAAVALTLPPNPLAGEKHTLVAEGGNISIVGPLASGTPNVVLEGTAVELVFDGTNWESESSNAAAQAAARAQATWHINATTGNDANDGLTAGTALQTWAAMVNRFGPGRNTLTSPAVDIFVDSDLPPSDPINLNLAFAPGGQIIRVHGSRTTTRSGTITALQTMDRTTNTPYQITDPGVASWIPDVGNRLRITNSPTAMNAIAWVAKGFGGGESDEARMSNFAQVPNFAPGDVTDVTPVVPSVGDSYVIEQLRRAFYGTVTIYSGGTDVGAVSTLQFQDFDFQDADPTIDNDDDLLPNQGSGNSPIPDVTYLGCKFEPSTFATSGEVNFLNCCFVSVAGIKAFACCEAGLSLATFIMGAGTQAGGIDGANLDFDFMIQGASLTVRGGSWPRIGTLAVFDSPGDGIHCDPGAMIENSQANGNDSGLRVLWGSDNAGFGYNGLAGSQLFLDPTSVPFITGDLGEFQLGGTTAAQPYSAVSGTYLAALPNTWTSTSLHVPDQNAHIIGVAT